MSKQVEIKATGLIVLLQGSVILAREEVLDGVTAMQSHIRALSDDEDEAAELLAQLDRQLARL